jgi:transporter, putative fucose permease
MYSLLLAVIYLAFISLGLPDALLGSGWPTMYTQLQVPFSYAGIISMIISAGTIVSSFFSDRLTRKFGAGLVTAVSVLLTAGALFGFSVSDSFYLLCIMAIPYGLGAGAVDAALNNYVALHYSSRHMSWLHCFWGVGAAASPYIMGFCLGKGLGWSRGYFSVSMIQIVITAILFISLPLWKSRADEKEGGIEPKGAEAEQIQTDQTKAVPSKALSFREILRIKGAPYILITFFAYSAMESTTGLWASSYLVQYLLMEPEKAAKFASFFYLGITVGRFLCGFVADKMGDKALIRLGSGIAGAGILLVLIPFPVTTPALLGLVIIGFGCAPVYPAIIHSTPFYFGKENSQALIGIQMACAYVGSTFMPPLLGTLAARIGIWLYPVFLLVFEVLMVLTSEKLNRIQNGSGTE